jgi:hypothetical protein
MGCGASVNDPNAVSPFSPHSPGGTARLPDDEPPEIPDRHAICLARATRPDWNTSDQLVFETKLDDDVDEAVCCPKSHPLANMNGMAMEMLMHDDACECCSRCQTPLAVEESVDVCLECAYALCPKCHEEASEQKFPKEGRFYSQRQKGVGTWRIAGNVLTLVWELSYKHDTVIAIQSPRVWINAKTRMELKLVDPKSRIPVWFSPDVIAEKFQADTVATRSFECPVCFFELYMFPTGVIRANSRRSCSHYFHRECAHYLLQSMKGTGRASACPLCGAEFAEVKMMPDLAKDPRDWFATVDVDFGGSLDAYEVIEALGTVLPVNRHKLEKNVKAHWHEWDPDRSGTIELNEFVQPGIGLRDWILNNLQLLREEKSPNIAPQLDKNPRQWFMYWDRDKNGSLDKDEVIRAFLRTFCRDENGGPDLKSALDMREVASSLWNTLNYGSFDQLTFEEFVKPYGLMDQFMHNQTQCLYFGLDTELIA